MKITAVVEALVASGASPDTILAAVRAIESQQVDALEKRREADRNRQAKRRALTLSHVTSERSRSRAGGEDSSSNSEINEDRKEESKAPAAPTQRSELAKVLDSEHVEAVMEHRKGFKGKFTVRAAHLIALQFAKCDDPNAAADEMISRNWQSFKADWMENIRGRSPPRNGNGGGDPMMNEIRDRYNEPDEQDETFSPGGTIRSLPPPGTGGH